MFMLSRRRLMGVAALMLAVGGIGCEKRSESPAADMMKTFTRDS